MTATVAAWRTTDSRERGAALPVDRRPPQMSGQSALFESA